MNWDDLRIFLCVARRKKLAQAARDLKMDETTVSRRLKRLETELGQTLFERLRTGHELTAQGERLFTEAEGMESSAAAITAARGGSAQQLAGVLRISTAEGFGAYVLTPLVSEFSALYPEIEIDLVSGSGFLSLSRREADVAIGLSRFKSKQITSEIIYPYKLHLYGHRDYLTKHGDVKSVDDLTRFALIDYVDDLLYAEELRYFAENLPSQSPRLRSTSIIAQKRLVELGAGLAILPDFMVSENLVPVLPEVIKINRQFWFSTHQSLASLGKVKAFRKFLFGRIAPAENGSG